MFRYMQLVGGMLVNSDDPQYAWFADIYPRLMSEVRHTGEVTRLVRFAGHHLQFAGVEVERVADIPDGLVAWELGDDFWTIRHASGDIFWQAPLTWGWHAASGAGRWVGEFSAMCPEEWGGGREEFQMTANSYLIPGAHCDDEIALVAPDPAWPQQYAEFAAWLREALGPEVALRIEHYGSTAIPGIPAKPVIDVLVEVPSFDLARRQALPALNSEAWEYWWYHDHMVFIKRQALMGRRTHHVHLAPAGHRLWEGLAFCDYLVAHPDEVARYAALKQELAGRYQEDREGYTEAKTAYVREVTARALQMNRIR
ncbi:MAG: GrpB family protein [Armatimonadota bacterium]